MKTPSRATRCTVQSNLETLDLSLVVDENSVDFVRNIAESFETLVFVDVLDATVEAAALFCFPRTLDDAVRARLFVLNAPLPWWLRGSEHVPLAPPYVVKRVREILHVQAKNAPSLVRVAAALADVGDKALKIAARQNALAMLVDTIDELRRGSTYVESADSVVCIAIEKVITLEPQRPNPRIMQLLKTYLPRVAARLSSY